LTFRCLLESDPELQRPDMRPVPNASIEVMPNKASFGAQ
jgi:hypothetical protein